MQKLSGLSQVTILRAREDRGIRSCSLMTLWKIAQALGCEVKDLFEEV
ncbi:MAG: helix-turn-helix transcriptional regulator [Desulfohalobiaceae bacterium]|nr:helix-turn-helix transcriptional regulator [Desulfohalobiaceae bacterium]